MLGSVWEDSGDGGRIAEYAAGKALEVALRLAEFQDMALMGGGETIVNVASVAFVTARVRAVD